MSTYVDIHDSQFDFKYFNIISDVKDRYKDFYYKIFTKIQQKMKLILIIRFLGNLKEN